MYRVRERGVDQTLVSNHLSHFNNYYIFRRIVYIAKLLNIYFSFISHQLFLVY